MFSRLWDIIATALSKHAEQDMGLHMSFSKSCLSFFWLFSVKHRKQHYDCGEALYRVNPFFEILKKGILSRTVCFSSPAVNLLILGLA